LFGVPTLYAARLQVKEAEKRCPTLVKITVVETSEP